MSGVERVIFDPVRADFEIDKSAMATMYCGLCRRPVEARRQVGVGTAILAVFTAGLSLLAIPFYSRRCSICKSPAVSQVGPDGPVGDGQLARASALEERLRLAQGDLDAANTEIERLTEELDFYRKLLDDPASRVRDAGSHGDR
jgi:hypothetical protein